MIYIFVSVLTEDGKWENEIRKRTAIAKNDFQKLRKALRNRKTASESKRKVR